MRAAEQLTVKAGLRRSFEVAPPQRFRHRHRCVFFGAFPILFEFRSGMREAGGEGGEVTSRVSTWTIFF